MLHANKENSMHGNDDFLVYLTGAWHRGVHVAYLRTLIKSEEIKTRQVQKLAIDKNPQFLSYPNESWWK